MKRHNDTSKFHNAHQYTDLEYLHILDYKPTISIIKRLLAKLKFLSTEDSNLLRGDSFLTYSKLVTQCDSW